jgi:hypothetical protein
MATIFEEARRRRQEQMDAAEKGETPPPPPPKQAEPAKDSMLDSLMKKARLKLLRGG